MTIGINARTETKLVFNQLLLRSLEILQLPQLELTALIVEEVDQNPLLEWEPAKEPSGLFRGGVELAAKPSLDEHLAAQARESFPENCPCVAAMIADLDERGFLTQSLEELSAALQVCIKQLENTLRVLQTFDPPGIFARNLQESFLIQLTRRNETKSLAFQIIQDHFEDFLHGRYTKIKSLLRASTPELQNAIQILKQLSIRPGSPFQHDPPQPITPDLQISLVESTWIIESHGDALPPFRMNTQYLHLPSLPPEQKQTMRKFATSAKWLFRSIHRRRKLLIAIGTHLVTQRVGFFEGRTSLVPMPVAELAAECGVHESTISRAICNKYVAGPFGVLPLKQFVSSQSNQTAKELLQQIIAQEQAPLTDDQLAQKISQAGISVARRTISKYRRQLKIGPSSVRKHVR